VRIKCHPANKGGGGVLTAGVVTRKLKLQAIGSQQPAFAGSKSTKVDLVLFWM
jgi:hypothetical protein